MDWIQKSATCTGGYVMVTENNLANYIPRENFLAMRDEGWK